MASETMPLSAIIDNLEDLGALDPKVHPVPDTGLALLVFATQPTAGFLVPASVPLKEKDRTCGNPPLAGFSFCLKDKTKSPAILFADLDKDGIDPKEAMWRIAAICKELGLRIVCAGRLSAEKKVQLARLVHNGIVFYDGTCYRPFYTRSLAEEPVNHEQKQIIIPLLLPVAA